MSTIVEVVNVFVDENGAYGNPLGIVWASPATRGRELDIAADLAFSETVFIDGIADRVARARIFTPRRELPFAGHPTVGLAAWLHDGGDDVTAIVVPAGSARVRVDGDLVHVTALPQWCPPFEFTMLDDAAAVAAVDPDAYAEGAHYVWAWTDEAAGRVRARMFAPALGVGEDEATGSAAVRLSSELARDLDITQGAGSKIRTHVRYLGQQVEVGGRTSAARIVQVD